MAQKAKETPKPPVKAEDLGKADLVKAISIKTGLTQKDVSAVLESFVETTVGTVKAGGKVKLIGFGSFERRHREAREGRNPADNTVINIPARNVPAFKPGQSFKDACN